MSARLTRMFKKQADAPRADEAEPQPVAAPPVAPPPVHHRPADDIAVAERAVLIRTCIYVRTG